MEREDSVPLLHPLTRTWSQSQHLQNAAASASEAKQRQRSVPRAALGLYACGLLTALGISSLDSFLVLLGFFRLQRVRTRVWQCVLLNGLLFLGSLIWFWVFVDPCVRWLLVHFGTDQLVGPVFFESVYNVLWVYPMYVMTLSYVSPRFFDDIARGAFDHTQSQLAGRAGQRAAEAAAGAAAPDFWSSLDGTVHKVSDGAMLNSLIGVFYLQTVCLTEGSVLSLPSLLLNLVGLGGGGATFPTAVLVINGGAKLVLFCLYTWLYSLYCFNYKWSLLNWSVKKQISTIEAHWAFFAGFGTPAAAISVLLSPCVGLGCYSTCFPLLLLAAEVATQPSGHVGTRVMASVTLSAAPPPPKSGDASVDETGRLPTLRVFMAAEHVNGMILKAPVQTLAKGVAWFFLLFIVNCSVHWLATTMAAGVMLLLLFV